MKRQVLSFRSAVGSAVVAMLLASGCSGLHSKEGAPQTYTLISVAPSAVVSTPAGAVTLQVVRPLAAPGLDTDGIALLRDTHRLDYFAASRWPAPLPDLLQTLAVDALRASGHFRAVQPDATTLLSDDVLQIEIRHCEVEYSGDGAPVVHVQLLATLGQRSDRALLANVTAESSKPASENRMQPVVAAFQNAIDDALNQLAAHLTP
ncbi:MAG: ABC-type transport auxiliary lipoprotein family protein [Steroidobacteraceae bacterium]